ncbi:MAG: NgoFVII family restriction endonuclease [Stigonema ocellatum SAG 48.90 = DSM 106950]|nr:NgoFVII family restriction endonuclease [Stigonema ocellatum SAG 48.90 = DSM 106950]
MPRIFDNIDLQLLPILRETLKVSYRADFCVGYFNLRGWRKIDDLIEQYVGSEKACCRLLIGMQSRESDEVHAAFTLGTGDGRIDNNAIVRFKKRMAAEFRKQLTIGAPTNQDEAGLRRLSHQLKTKKLIIKLFLRHPLHAKLYLVHRQDPNAPIVGFLGSSNLTLPGLAKQGELNVDILDHDACNKLQKWFDDRWKDYGCVDISKELAEIIDESWAREELIPPYHIYLKIAYHLSHEAIAGLSEFCIPREFNNLFDFQKAAVQLAARHVTRRGGVLVGDVVGLGKTLVGTALAKILQEDCFLETLIICPKNLVQMWQEYVDQYRLYAKVLPISKVQNQLPELRRYRVVLIDESHNLRNREGKRYRAIAEYITANESKCILLSATPYNKTYLDLSSQLRLFVPEDQDLGFRPEALINELGGSSVGELEFIRRHQCSVRSLAAFEKSEHPDDWRELMKRYMVRRTRSFIKDNYAKSDPPQSPFAKEGERGVRKYLEFSDGTGVTGQSKDPTELTGRFSPVSNGKRDRVSPSNELRVLIATDVLSEGHNLQDCAIIINWDLPWAIIRLIQRAGRVDRIGQNAEKILCYSFLPAEGVERIINLRGQLRQRLQENAEVLGTDEAFFEDDDAQVILDLYNEKSGILDGEEDTEVDLTSEAFQIWKKATDDNPALKKMIEEMPNVVYSTRAHTPQPVQPEGVLLYMKTTEGNDSLIYVDREGNSVTQSQLAVLKMAACEETISAIPKDEQHHELVKKGAELIAEEEKNAGGQLGRPSGARFRTYERLKSYVQEMKGTLFVTDELLKAIDDIYRYPLRQSAIDTLNRQLRSGISNQQLAELVVALRMDDRLCIVSEEVEKREPQIICSLGLFQEK